MPDEDALSGAAEVIRGFANTGFSSDDSPYFSVEGTNGSLKPNAPHAKIALPGESSALKRDLEKELAALSTRIKHLEAQASAAQKQILPDTPIDSGGPTSPFAIYGSIPSPQKTAGLPTRSYSGSTRQAHVSSLLAGNNRSFSDEDFGHLREHVDKQAQEIKMQRDTISGVSDQLRRQQEEAHHAFALAHNEEINKLQKELVKNQQANLAFKKILKDIGTIVTNVANGDLNHKVQINDKEMDDEIRDFKKTINRMMDQLQVFGSEVSRVAHEVGTEGKLGGQAQITGVNGIWKELTNNGPYSHQTLYDDANRLKLTKWPPISRSRSVRSPTSPRR